MRQALVLPICLLTLAAACRGGATPTPTAEPADSSAGELRSVREIVQFREREQDPLREVPPSQTMPVSAAANVVVGETGRAEITWPEFMGAELLSGSDILVSLAEPGTRHVVLDQAAGTSRYRLLGSDPADFTVEAGWIEAKLSEGPGDVIVSFVPGDPATVWVVAVRGSATVAMAGDDSAAPVTLEEGDGVGIAAQGDMPEPMPVTMADVETWYSTVAAGAAETSIVPVAIVCTATIATPLRAAAGTDAAESGESLATDDMIRIVGLDDTGEWAEVGALVAPRPRTISGWVAASSLACNAPIEVAADIARAALGTAVATTPAPTVATPARTIIVVSATPPSVTPTAGLATATPTPTVGGVASIEFWADDDEVDPGECTTVHWKTANIDSVWYNGQGVTGEGSREECPTSKTTYTLRVKKRDGTEETHTVTVDVEAAPAPEPSDTAVPAPPTTQPTDEPTDEPTPEPTGGAPRR